MNSSRYLRIVKSHRFSVLMHIILCIALVFCLAVFLSRMFSFVMVSADDVLYEKIMSGTMTGTPDAHNYFLRYPLSVAIVFFYDHFGGIPWYQIFIVASLFLCYFCLIERVLTIQRKIKVKYVILVSLLFLAICTEIIVHFEWTVTAGLLGSIALYRVCSLSAASSKKCITFELAICFVLFVLCFNLRKTVFLMFVPLLCLSVLFRFVQDCTRSPIKRRSITAILHEINIKKHLTLQFLSLLILAVLFTTAIHCSMYSSEEWKDYEEYTHYRAILFDYSGYPDYDAYSKEYIESGISKEAYLLMDKDYNFIVPCNRFESMRLDQIATISREQYQSSLTNKLDYTYNRLKSICKTDDLLVINFLMILVSASGLLVARKRGIIDTVYLFLALSICGGISLYLSFQGRLPDHVVRCIDYSHIFIFVAYLINVWNEHPRESNYSNNSISPVSFVRRIEKHHAKLFGLIILLVLVVCASASLYQVKLNNERRVKLATAHYQIVNYCKAHQDNVYLRDFWSFSQRGELFFHYDYSAENYLVTGGWSYNTPVFDATLNKHQCTDFLAAVETNDNIFYLVNEARCQEVIERLEAYFRSQDMNVVMEISDSFETENENVIVLNFHYIDS